MKLETAAMREEKVRSMARKMTSLTLGITDDVPIEEQNKLHVMFDELDDLFNAYRAYKVSWDSEWLDVVERVEGTDTYYKTQRFDTLDTVMSKVRQIFCFIGKIKSETLNK